MINETPQQAVARLFKNDIANVRPIEAWLKSDNLGRPFWECKLVADTTYDRVISLANEGLSQSEIATELGVNRSTVSRAWRKAETEGHITRKPKQKDKSGDYPMGTQTRSGVI